MNSIGIPVWPMGANTAMARYRKSDVGERRTASLRLQLTPSERAELEQGAAAAGTHLSQYVRELCLRRAATAPVVAGTKRNRAARGLIYHFTVIGNNLNQIARVSHQSGHATGPSREDLRAMLKVCEGLRDHVHGLMRGNVLSWQSGDAPAHH